MSLPLDPLLQDPQHIHEVSPSLVDSGQGMVEHRRGNSYSVLFHELERLELVPAFAGLGGGWSIWIWHTLT